MHGKHALVVPTQRRDLQPRDDVLPPRIEEMVHVELADLLAASLHAEEPDGVGCGHVDGVVELALVLVAGDANVADDGKVVEREAEVGLELREAKTPEMKVI